VETDGIIKPACIRRWLDFRLSLRLRGSGVVAVTSAGARDFTSFIIWEGQDADLNTSDLLLDFPWKMKKTAKNRRKRLVRWWSGKSIVKSGFGEFSLCFLRRSMFRLIRNLVCEVVNPRSLPATLWSVPRRISYALTYRRSSPTSATAVAYRCFCPLNCIDNTQHSHHCRSINRPSCSDVQANVPYMKKRVLRDTLISVKVFWSWINSVYKNVSAHCWNKFSFIMMAKNTGKRCHVYAFLEMFKKK